MTHASTSASQRVTPRTHPPSGYSGSQRSPDSLHLAKLQRQHERTPCWLPPATLSFHDTWRPRANPWVIAITVTLATFMEALDTSIANVAMPHIGGSLSASPEEATWVLTSYLVANAMVLPISGWIANRIGRKRFYMTCVFLFTVARCSAASPRPSASWSSSASCKARPAAASSPASSPSSPTPSRPQKRSMAFAVYGVAVVIAPVLGPTVGGWIVDNYSWRWIFFLNIPVGILSLYLTNRLVEDPPYLAEIRKRRESIDYWGLGLLIVAIGALQIMLDKGQEDDWFSSRFIVTCCVVAAIGLALFFWRELPSSTPSSTCASSPAQRRHDPARHVHGRRRALLVHRPDPAVPAGDHGLLRPAGRHGRLLRRIVLMFSSPSPAPSRPNSIRAWLVAMGFVITTFGLWRMTAINLNVSFGMAVSWRVFIALGLPFLFIPINTLCYAGIPQEKYNEVSGLTALMRNLGGSVGISFVTTLLARLTQKHLAMLDPHTVVRQCPVRNAALRNGRPRWRAARLGWRNRPTRCTTPARRSIGMAQIQARLLAYVDVIWVMVALTAILIPLPSHEPPHESSRERQLATVPRARDLGHYESLRYTAPSACSRSAITSSLSSMPIESRNRPSVIPIAAPVLRAHGPVRCRRRVRGQ